MASLLGLPCELRLLILEHALKIEREAPSLPSASNKTEIHAWGHQDPSVTDPIAPKIYEERRETRLVPNCLPLLSISRQLSAETQRLLNAQQASTVYKLDISVVDEYRLFPTWVALPRLTDRVSALHVNVRLFGYSPLCNGVREASTDAWFQPVDWGFSACLARIFLYGPQGDPSNYTCRDFTVDTLVLDFHSAEDQLPFPPPNITFDDWYSQQGQTSIHLIDANVRYKTPPKWYAQWILSGMDDCEEDWLHEWEWLFSQVGAAKFFVEGNLLEEFDPAKKLEDFSPEEREEIVKKRKRLGLPVVELDDQDEAGGES